MYSLALGSILAQSAGSTARGFASFIPYLLIVVVFYLLLIRPQQRKAKQHQELVQSIGPGDRVVTIGGIHGIVEVLNDDTAVIEVAPGTSITLTRAAIARRVADVEPSADEDAVADAEDTP